MMIMCMWIVLPANAQFRIGIKGGVNISSVHFNSDLLGSGNVCGFQVGPMIETSLPLVGFGIDASVLFSRRGLEGNNSGAKKTLRTNYLDVPVNLKWKFGLPLMKVYVAAGPYVSFRVGGDNKWTVLGDQLKSKTVSGGLNFGAGIEVIKHLQVGLNYGLGLTNNYRAKAIDLNAKDRGWAVTAAFLL